MEISNEEYFELTSEIKKLKGKSKEVLKNLWDFKYDGKNVQFKAGNKEYIIEYSEAWEIMFTLLDATNMLGKEAEKILTDMNAKYGWNKF